MIRRTLRRLIGPLAVIGVLASIGLLSLADRAPDAVRAVLRRGQRLGSRGEDLVGFDLVDRGDVPLAFDTAGHIALWAIAGFVAHLVFSRRTTPGFIAVSLFTLSAGIEIGQRLLSSTRTPSVSDLVANGIGVTIGVLAASICLGVIHLFGRLSRSLTG